MNSESQTPADPGAQDDESLPEAYRAMSPEERAVAHHYDEEILQYELERLDRYCPVEFGVTLRALERWVEGRGVAVELGVGSGAYSSWLAARGFDLHLVDLSGRLLEATHERLQAERRSARILSSHQRSATDLDGLADQCADVVLALGPLYHLRDARDRERVLREAFRVLKNGGVLFAAGVNRIAFLRDAFRESPERGAQRRAHYLSFLRDGNLDPEMAPPLGYAHLSTAREFEAQFAEGFERIALLGVDSFTSPAQDKLTSLSAADRDAWLDVVEAIAGESDALACSDHFLYVGRRRQQWIERQ